MNETAAGPPCQITFGGLTICFDHRVLAPRPWTEAQSEWGAELLIQAPLGPVLELCAGAGHIGLRAIRDSDRSLVMVDVNPAAQEIARANAEANQMSSRVETRLAPLASALGDEERFALILADPPWVRTADTSMYPDDPVLAIDGGDDGLALARVCMELIERHLVDGGSALLQLGTRAQAHALAEDVAGQARPALDVLEVRHGDRGVIVRIDRRSAV